MTILIRGVVWLIFLFFYKKRKKKGEIICQRELKQLLLCFFSLQTPKYSLRTNCLFLFFGQRIISYYFLLTSQFSIFFHLHSLIINMKAWEYKNVRNSLDCLDAWFIYLAHDLYGQREAFMLQPKTWRKSFVRDVIKQHWRLCCYCILLLILDFMQALFLPTEGKIFFQWECGGPIYLILY